jgi:hypothetical protein
LGGFTYAHPLRCGLTCSNQPVDPLNGIRLPAGNEMISRGQNGTDKTTTNITQIWRPEFLTTKSRHGSKDVKSLLQKYFVDAHDELVYVALFSKKNGRQHFAARWKCHTAIPPKISLRVAGHFLDQYNRSRLDGG